MASHRETCIHRIAELADDDALRAAVVWALVQKVETQELSFIVQSVLELRDAIVDEQHRQELADEADRRRRSS